MGPGARAPKPGLGLFFRSPAAWVGTAAACVALGLAVLAAVTARDAARLASGGVETVAEVIDRQENVSRHKNGGLGTRYFLVYRFEDAGGRTFEGREDVPAGLFFRTPMYSHLPVRYWPEDPKLSEIEIGGTAEWASLLGMLCLAAAAVAAGALLLGWQRVRPLLRLRDRGRPVRARVVAHVAVRKVAGARVQTYRARWEAPGGLSGETFVGREDQLPAVGSDITVLTDPDGKTAGVWEGDLTAG